MPEGIVKETREERGFLIKKHAALFAIWFRLIEHSILQWTNPPAF